MQTGNKKVFIGKQKCLQLFKNGSLLIRIMMVICQKRNKRDQSSYFCYLSKQVKSVHSNWYSNLPAWNTIYLEGLAIKVHSVQSLCH